MIEELISVLSYRVKDQEKAVKFQRLLDDIEKAAVKASKALAALTVGVGTLAKKFAETATKNYEWAQSLGIDEETASRFDYVAQQFGGSINDMKESMKGWSRYSIQSGKSMEEIYLREAKSIEGMSNAQSAAFLTARKYSEVEIKMIQQGEDALRDYFDSAKVLSNDQQKSLQKLGRSFRQTFSDINYAINSALANISDEVASSVVLLGRIFSSIIASLAPFVSLLARGLVMALTTVMIVLAPILKVIQFIWKVINSLTFGLAGLVAVIGVAITILTLISTLIVSKVLGALIAFKLSLLANVDAIKSSIVIMRSWISVSKLQLFWTNALALGKKALAMIGLTENAIEIALTYTKKNQLKMMILMAGAYIGDTLYKKLNTIATWLNTLATNINTKGVLFNTTALKANILAWAAHAKTLFSMVGPALKATWMSIEYIVGLFTIGLGPVLAAAKAALIAFGKALIATSVQMFKMAASAFPGFIASMSATIVKTYALAVSLLSSLIPALVAAGAELYSMATAALPGLITGLASLATGAWTLATALFSAVVPSLISTTVALWNLAAAAWASGIGEILAIAGLVILVLAGIGAALYAIYKYWGNIVDAVKSAWEWVYDLFDWIKNGQSLMAKLLKWTTMLLFPLSGLYFYWEEIINLIGTAVDAVKNLFGKLWGFITSYYSKLYSLFDEYVLSPIKKLFGSVVGFLGKLFAPVLNFFSEIYSAFDKTILEPFRVVFDVLLEDLAKIWRPIENFFKKIYNFITGIFSFVKDSVINPIKNFFGGMFTWISDLFHKIFGWIIDNPIVKAVSNFFSDGINEYNATKEKNKKEREEKLYGDEPGVEYEEDFDSEGNPVSEKQRRKNKKNRIQRRKAEAAIWKDDRSAPESAYGSSDQDRKIMDDVNKQQTSIRRKEVAYGVRLFNATTENYQEARKDGRVQKAAEQAAREMYGPSVIKATPQEINNSVSNCSISVQNNNTINTSASSGPAIANYLKNANDLQGTGFGLSGVY